MFVGSHSQETHLYVMKLLFCHWEIIGLKPTDESSFTKLYQKNLFKRIPFIFMLQESHPFGAMLFMDDNHIISTLKRQHYCITQLRFLIIDQL